MRFLLMAALLLVACGRSGPTEASRTEAPTSAGERASQAEFEAEPGPGPAPQPPPPPPPPPPPSSAPVECGTAVRADSVEVLDVPFLSGGRLIIYTVEGPSGPNRSFAVCGETEQPLDFETLPQRLGGYGLTLDSAEARIAYARLALRVRSGDHIVLLDSADALARGLRAGEERRARQLRQTYQGEISPPTSAGAAPWTLIYWGLTTDLLHIEVVIAEDGGVTVTDTVREADLPVPMRV